MIGLLILVKNLNVFKKMTIILQYHLVGLNQMKELHVKIYTLMIDKII